jgi:hypothetical protein
MWPPDSDDAVRAVNRVEKDPMPSDGWRAVRRAGVGLVVGLAVGLGLTWFVVGRGDDAPSAGRGDRARLLAAWERSQHATYTLEGSFRRTTDDGNVVDDPLVVVQRPPDRIALGFGSWDGVVGGRSVHCVRIGRSGAFRDCVVGEEVDRVATDRAELEQLSRLTSGESPEYRVTDLGGGCFLLRVADGRLPTPYGLRSRYCFDPATGALARTRIEHEGAVDEVVVRSLTGEVAPEDLPATA